MNNWISQYRNNLDRDCSMVVLSCALENTTTLQLARIHCQPPVYVHTFYSNPTTIASEGIESLFLLNSSGTTGPPKVIAYDFSTIRSHAKVIADSLGLSLANEYIALCRPNYAYGLSVINSHHYAAIPVTFLPTVLPETLAEANDKTVIYVLPSQLTEIALTGVSNPASLKLIVAGGYTSKAVIRILQSRFPNASFVNMYGRAESGPRIAIWSGLLKEFEAGTIGLPLENVSLAIKKDQPTGEMIIDTPWSAKWVYHPGADEAGQRNPPSPVSGDVCTFEDGVWRHLGRTDSIINLSGCLININDVRRILLSELPILNVWISVRPALISGDNILEVHAAKLSSTALTSREVKMKLHELIGKAAVMARVKVDDQVERDGSAK